MDINLLPWRTARRLSQKKQLVTYISAIIVICFLVVVYLQHHAHQRIEHEKLQNQQLQQRVHQLQVLNREQRSHKEQALTHDYQHRKIHQQEMPLETALIQINYAKASDLVLLLKDKSNPFLSARGMLAADPRTNMIWVQDVSEQVNKIKDLLKQLDTPNRQVLIEARIVNMSKECADDVGVRFGLLRAVEPSQIDQPPQSPHIGGQVGQRLNIDLGALPLDSSPASIGIAIATLEKHILLDLELSALESEGKAKIIASPRLMTTNQEPATIQSGEDIPYQEYMASGATAVSFKKAVLSLKVIPQITSDGKLMMALSINQDSDSGRRVQGVPIILTKSIETNVLVNNGQTIVLGGIYKQDKNNSVASVPFLGTLPVIGYLFRRTQVRMRKEELLIFITPRIISNSKDLTN